MEPEDDQEVQVKKDLANLTRTLTSENINPDAIFTKKRGIRSCTPAIEAGQGNGNVTERLKRVQPPPVE
jgi:hypothetical protein